MPPSLSPSVPEQWTGPFAPGEEAKPSGHCVQHQPCTLAKRGTDNSKAQEGFGQSGQGSQAHTNVQSSVLLSSSLCHTPLVCRTYPLGCLLLFFTPTGGEHPSSSHCLAKLRPSCIHPPSPWEPLTTALTVPSHPAAFAATYSPMTPHGDRRGTGMGCASQRKAPDMGCWSLPVLLQSSQRVAE